MTSFLPQVRTATGKVEAELSSQSGRWEAAGAEVNLEWKLGLSLRMV